MTEFVLIRHGETAWNVSGRMQGHLDVPLNTVGLAQAAAVGRRFGTQSFDAIYSSDLDRAYRTAAPLLAHGRSIEREPRLRERHYGVLQGLTRDEAIIREPTAWSIFKSRTPHGLVEGAEKLFAFSRRVMDLLTELRERHAGRRLLLFTHGGVLDVAYRTAMGMALEAPRNFSIANASVNVLTHREDKWSVERWGDVEHLADLPKDELTA